MTTNFTNINNNSRVVKPTGNHLTLSSIPNVCKHYGYNININIDRIINSKIINKFYLFLFDSCPPSSFSVCTHTATCLRKCYINRTVRSYMAQPALINFFNADIIQMNTAHHLTFITQSEYHLLFSD